ncbi:MAG: carboxypeptidase regulatory-like domain-containing protein [Eggerthellaceae bacterium]|nr:carboxypeptidase regulatory-like domain-containing protein [Eggerthellaceae bacterium]
MNPVDAEKYGIEDDDIVRIFNERGWVMGAAIVTDRIAPNTLLQDHGARCDPIEPGVSDRGGVFWNEELGIAQKCTGCQHLVDEGELPHCVDHCPTGALTFGNEADMDLTNCVAAEEGGVLWYKNLPGLFIAGEVWDPAPNEIIENAKVVLRDDKGFQVAETLTDGFGDFWFRKLEAGDYEVVIKADGFETVKRAVHLDKSLNIGDFPMQPKAEEEEGEEVEA